MNKFNQGSENIYRESESISHSVVSDSLQTPAASQALLPMEFSRQEYWSGLPILSSGFLPNPEIEPRCHASRQTLLSVPPGQLGIKTDIYIIETEMKVQK